MGAHHRAGSGRCSQQSKEKYRARTRWRAYLGLARAVAVCVDAHPPDLQRVGQSRILPDAVEDSEDRRPKETGQG